jgi:hypothetical protein
MVKESRGLDVVTGDAVKIGEFTKAEDAVLVVIIDEPEDLAIAIAVAETDTDAFEVGE